MARPPYTPQLTTWSAADGGGGAVERDCVEHEGTLSTVRREDRRTVTATDDDGEDVGDERETIEIDGEVFLLADEKTVAVHGGRALRCVEYPYFDAGEPVVLRLTVTDDGEVAEVVSPDGALRVLGSGGYFETGAGTREHVLDVQGEHGAFLLLVSVRQEAGRIVRVQRLN